MFSHYRPDCIGVPSFNAPVKMVIVRFLGETSHRSEVAAGRIVAFHSRSSLLLSSSVNSKLVLTAHAGNPAERGKQLNTSYH